MPAVYCLERKKLQGGMNLNLVESLQGVGFTLYESKAISACLGSEESTATEIAGRAGIPVTKVYSVLKALENRGILESGFERPKKYTCINITELKKKLVEEKAREQEKILRVLEEREGKPEKLGKVSVFWGKGELKKRIHSEAGKSKNVFLLLSEKDTLQELAKPYVLRKVYRRAVEGKNTRVILGWRTPSPDTSLESLVALVKCGARKTSAETGSLIISENKAVMSLCDPAGRTVGGIDITEPSTVQELQGYYEMIWEQAEPVELNEEIRRKREEKKVTFCA